MKRIERCFCQLFKSEPRYIDGVLLDNCSKCTYNPKENKRCVFYSPIKMLVYEVDSLEEKK